MLLLIAQVMSQASGDPTCSVDTNTASNVLTLMDSYRYNNLIQPGGVWTVVNDDNSDVKVCLLMHWDLAITILTAVDNRAWWKLPEDAASV